MATPPGNLNLSSIGPDGLLSESPEASQNPASEAHEANSFLLGSEESATDAQGSSAGPNNTASTTNNTQPGPEAQASTNAESQAADPNTVPEAQAGTEAASQAADQNTVPEAQAGTEAESQATDQHTANTPLLRGSSNPLYEGEMHASPWYAKLATGTNYEMTPVRASAEELTRLTGSGLIEYFEALHITHEAITLISKHARTARNGPN
jgi:hypothetical protein